MRTADGIELHEHSWMPQQGTRAVVGLVHGLGEHAGRYEHVGTGFAARGFAMVAVDLRGHGRSGGRRGDIPSYEAVLDDIDRLVDRAGSLQPEVPRFLYGHSLGGALVINYLLRRRPDLEGAVASAPALRPGFAPPAWKLAVGRVAAAVWPTLSLANELDPDGISRDPEVVRRYLADPLVFRRLSARLGIAVLDEGERALREAGQLAAPLLLLHGTADRLTDPAASREFARRAGDRCTLHTFEGLAHELHNEPERDAVIEVVLRWMEQRLAER